MSHISGSFKSFAWKLLIKTLKLLKAQHIRMALVEPINYCGQTRANPIDIEAGYRPGQVSNPLRGMLYLSEVGSQVEPIYVE